MPVNLDTDTIENRIDRLRRKTGLNETTLAELAADPRKLAAVEEHEREHARVAAQTALNISDPMGGSRMTDAFGSIFGSPTQTKSDILRDAAKARGMPIVDIGLVDPDALSPEDAYGYLLKHTDEVPDTSIEAAIRVMEEHVQRTGDGHHRLAAMKATASRGLG
jgi:hypothetical protein